jgi:tetratricopeptide (TPR) repeat protein
MVIIGVSVFASPNLALSQDAGQAKSSDRLISVTKRIIRQAAIVGIEEAGTRIMGSAWPVFKKVLTPVFEELQNRFPKFFLLEKQPGEQARLVAEEAITSLSADPSLQKKLTDGFLKLESGQEQILEELGRLEDILVVLGDTFKDFEKESERRFNKIMQAIRETRELELSLEVADYSEWIEHTLSPNISPEVKAGVKFYVEVGSFMIAVVRAGESEKTYRRVIEGIEYRVTPSVRYVDSQGRTNRDLRVSRPEHGSWITTTNTFYRINGYWESSTHVTRHADLQAGIKATDLLLKEAKILYRKGQYGRVIDVLNKVTAFDSTNAEVYFTRALAYDQLEGSYFQKEQHELAMKDYKRASELIPSWGAPIGNIGRLYMKRNLYDTAIDYFNRAITLDPTIAEFIVERGRAYFQKANYQVAIADFTWGLELQPNNIEGLFYRGLSYKILGHKVKAVNDFNRILSLEATIADTFHKQFVPLAKRHLGDLQD